MSKQQNLKIICSNRCSIEKILSTIVLLLYKQARKPRCYWCIKFLPTVVLQKRIHSNRCSILMHWPSLQVNSPSEHVVSLIGLTLIATFLADTLSWIFVDVVNWVETFLAVKLGGTSVAIALGQDLKITRDWPTPVWHLSSRTPEKSTLWTPVDGKDEYFRRIKSSPNRSDASGEMLTATLVGSFLSYQTQEGIVLL